MGLLRAVRPWDGWIAGWGFDISKGDPDLNPELLLERIRTLVGDPELEVEIERTSVWYVNQAYATEYSRGRVFCGGDAVHRHPPSSGLGLNTCVQDAFNLAWKLAYVVKGHAGSGLLETYSVERAPVGKQIVARANQSRLDYGPMKAVFRVEGAENPVAAGIARLRDPGPEGEQARLAAQAALPAWRATSLIKRADVFFRLRHLLVERADELAAIIAHGGNPGDRLERLMRDGSDRIREMAAILVARAGVAAARSGAGRL